MTDQTNDDVLELTVEAPALKKPGLVAGICSDFLYAAGGTAVTSAGIMLGATTGVLSAGAFGLAGEVINAALVTPGDPGTAFATGVAINAPFIHHIFRGKLPERLTGISNPDGAFTRATKATSYIAGALGALATAATLIASSPNDKIDTRSLDQNFERHPQQMHDARNKMTVVRTDVPSPVFVLNV